MDHLDQIRAELDGLKADKAELAAENARLRNNEDLLRSAMITKRQFAKTILNMNYGTLREVAADLSAMKDEDVRPKIETPEEFAEVLFDWAEANADGEDDRDTSPGRLEWTGKPTESRTAR